MAKDEVTERRSVSLYERHFIALQQEADIYYEGKISMLLRKMIDMYFYNKAKDEK